MQVHLLFILMVESSKKIQLHQIYGKRNITTRTFSPSQKRKKIWGEIEEWSLKEEEII